MKVKTMPKFTVAVIRIGYACRDMEVEAANEEEAKEVALDHAGGESFSEHHSEYKVDHVTSGLRPVARTLNRKENHE